MNKVRIILSAVSLISWTFFQNAMMFESSYTDAEGFTTCIATFSSSSWSEKWKESGELVLAKGCEIEKEIVSLLR